MKPASASSWRPILVALTIWFAHFMACWVASELVWPGQRTAHTVAAGATVIALIGLALHWRGLRRSKPRGDVLCWKHRLALRATALATTAVLFSALTAVLLLP